jgi:hypothetical protein
MLDPNVIGASMLANPPLEPNEIAEDRFCFR